jgi:hypothetical protein
MLRRGFVLTRSDFLWDEKALQNQTYGLARWVPITGIGADTNDIYKIRSGMVYHNVFAFDLYSSDPSYWDKSRKNLLEVGTVRDLFLGDFTPLTTTTDDESSCIAWQFSRNDLNKGLIQAFRRRGCAQASLTVHLNGLSRSKQYELVDMDDGRSWSASGDELMDSGLAIPLIAAPTAKIFTFSLK